MSGYIGNIPVPQATQTRDTFTATAGQTSFATIGYTPSFLDVYLNGVHLQNGVDYTASNASDVVLTTGAALNDVLEVVAYTTFDTANVTGAADFTATGTVTAANISDGTDTVATSYVVSGSAKASFRYTQSTNTILSSKNVSSILDDSRGEFTVNCTAAFLSLDTQRLSGMIHQGTGRVISARVDSLTSSALPFRTTDNSALTDTDNLSSGVAMGDLA